MKITTIAEEKATTATIDSLAQPLSLTHKCLCEGDARATVASVLDSRMSLRHFFVVKLLLALEALRCPWLLIRCFGREHSKPLVFMSEICNEGQLSEAII